MPIPRIIHYCWFGPKKIPELESKCISSWHLFFEGYKFMFWNENNFDINETSFVKQAYETKHYAFVSDYVRTKVLYEIGGIYLDTDVEVIGSFNRLLKKNKCFLGFETRAKIGTAIMAFTPKHPILKLFMNFYKNNSFLKKNGNVNTIANVTILTDILIKRGLITGGKTQLISDIQVLSREYFYPKKISETQFKITSQTVAIHKCSNSWMTERERKRGNNAIWINFLRPTLRSVRNLGLTIIGEKRIQSIEIIIRNYIK